MKFKRIFAILLSGLILMATPFVALAETGTTVTKDTQNNVVVSTSTSEDTFALNAEEKTVIVDETFQLMVDPTPEDNVTWETTDQTIATVTAEGLVKGISRGTCDITATIAETQTEPETIKTCKITVENGISIDKTAVSMYVDNVEQLTATTHPAGTIAWESADESIAAVDQNGTVTAKKAGAVVITAKANELLAVCTIIVKNPTLKLGSLKATVYIGLPETLIAIPAPIGTVKWKTSNRKIATVDQKGKVTAIKEGKATITATYKGIEKNCAVTVKKPSLTLSPGNLTIFAKNTFQLTAVAYPQNRTTWKSSDKNIVAVDADGVVTGIKNGTATITATLGSIKQQSTVTVLKNTYKPNKSKQTLMKGSSVRLYVNNTDASGYSNYVTYNISAGDDYNIVELSTKENVCTVKALNIGEATIWAHYTFYLNGAYVTCSNPITITVVDAGISQQQFSIAVKGTKQLKLKKAEKAGTGIQKITWASSDKKVAKVDAKGLVTGKKAGSADITAKVVYADSTQTNYKTSIKVSNPKLNSTATISAINSTYSVKLKGTNAYSDIQWKSKKTSIAAVAPDGRITTFGKTGTTSITAVVDGKKLTHKITVTNPRLSEAFKPVAVGGTTVIKIKGTAKKSKISYKTGNPAVATVNRQGKVKTHLCGVAYIEATADGQKMTFEVNVAPKKAIDSIYKGEQIMYSSSYSQAVRMTTGYYDCSSLVYRAYNPGAAALLGGSDAWAPTAAAEAQYLERRGKAISYSGLDASQLQPGDLIFYGLENNGRYKGIYHVSMYYGGGYRLEKPFRQYYPADNIVMIARPL
ncbi:Ig-like domain-containing protein [Lachnospiraceae bacterium ZAX-1]